MAIIGLLSAKYKRRYLEAEEKRRDNSKTSEKWQKNNGIFTYTDDGFAIRLESGEKQIKWSEVDTIIAYKRDLYTVDQICLNVFYNSALSYSISEDTPGWPQFVIRMGEAFSQINKDWEMKVAVPAFKTNMTLLYDKQDRTLAQVIKTC